jgi:hypothetical protein
MGPVSKRKDERLDLGPSRRSLLSGVSFGFTTRDQIRTDLGLEAEEVERNTCSVCGARVRVMVFRGTGYCSQQHEKVVTGPAVHPSVNVPF